MASFCEISHELFEESYRSISKRSDFLLNMTLSWEAQNPGTIVRLGGSSKFDLSNERLWYLMKRRIRSSRDEVMETDRSSPVRLSLSCTISKLRRFRQQLYCELRGRDKHLAILASIPKCLTALGNELWCTCISTVLKLLPENLWNHGLDGHQMRHPSEVILYLAFVSKYPALQYFEITAAFGGIREVFPRKEIYGVHRKLIQYTTTTKLRNQSWSNKLFKEALMTK